MTTTTPVYDSLISSISQYKIGERYHAGKMNEIMLVWHSHVKLLNTKYPGYDIKSICPMTSDGHLQDWQSSNGMNWLSKFQGVESDLINYKYQCSPKQVYIQPRSRRCTGSSQSPTPGSKEYLITMGLIHPFTPEDIRIANRSAYSLPVLTPALLSHPYVIERHTRFGYPIDEMIRNKNEADQKQINRKEMQDKEAEDARIWAANRLPGEPPLNENVIGEYRWNIKKTEKISKLIQEHPSYTNVEVESILHYIDSQKTTNSKYQKNTLLAMKSLNRFAKENDIDINSAIVVWNEYLK